MDEKIVEAVAGAIRDKGPACEYCTINHFAAGGLPADCCCYDGARAAIAAHTAALAEAGFLIVRREPTMSAMEEIFGQGPVDGIPLAEAERRFRKAIEVLAATPDQR